MNQTGYNDLVGERELTKVMDTNEILKVWEQDSVLSELKLTEAIKNVHALHAKYLGWLYEAKKELITLDRNFDKLRLDKYTLYTQGPSKEEKAKKKTWLEQVGAAKGNLSKTKEIDLHIDGDPDIISSSLNIAEHKFKVEVLENILQAVHNRSFLIKHMIDWKRREDGL